MANNNVQPGVEPSARPGFENEGEGNRTAARNYDAATERYIESGRVEIAAEAAEEALDGPEGNELRAAEQRARASPPG